MFELLLKNGHKNFGVPSEFDVKFFSISLQQLFLFHRNLSSLVSFETSLTFLADLGVVEHHLIVTASSVRTSYNWL